MINPLEPANETERLQALYRYQLLDTDPEEVFDRIVAIAARLFKVPIALFTLIDKKRQWYKGVLTIFRVKAVHRQFMW